MPKKEKKEESLGRLKTECQLDRLGVALRKDMAGAKYVQVTRSLGVSNFNPTQSIAPNPTQPSNLVLARIPKLVSFLQCMLLPRDVLRPAHLTARVAGSVIV